MTTQQTQQPQESIRAIVARKWLSEVGITPTHVDAEGVATLPNGRILPLLETITPYPIGEGHRAYLEEAQRAAS